MLGSNEMEGLLGSINLNRECIVLVKHKSRVYTIILTLVIVFMFPLVLFCGNLDHLINFVLNSLHHSSLSPSYSFIQLV